MTPEEIKKLNNEFAKQSPDVVLRYFIKNYKNKICLSSSLGVEDQVLTQMIVSIDKSVNIFTLDTGRLFPETYNLIDKTNKKYNINIKIFFPDKERVEEMVNTKGINLFYENLENRKLCCYIRKIEPLKRAFSNHEVWICGLRSEQSVTRIANKMIEWDEQNNLIKINPLINWTESEMWNYIRKYDIPYNELHDKGFPSIGCQPCTRAVESGKEIRSGRWWWEKPENKECGLHNRPKK
ncbi:MAG: phosphoadenylyl-sulfate reductase [Bacteroidetes bacterium]|nr:phosphoadenylyl-sulfate reductase [Bacteroidota bacterium]